MMAESSVPYPPGGMQEIVFSFDTTGSMSGCISQVKGRVQDMMQRLQADIPGIRIAVFAHGDYCDEDNYITRHIDFTSNIVDLCKFVKDTGPTHGGDEPECYELVLREVQTELSWTPASQRSLVMIGDAFPHDATDKQNVQNIDWKKESQALKDMGVKIYSVQCDKGSKATEFFKEIASVTNGKHLELSQFSDIFDVLMAICYREHGADFLQTYEKEVRARPGAVSTALDGMFGTLRSDDSMEMDADDSSDAGYASEDSPAASSRPIKRGIKRSGSKVTPVLPKKLKVASDEIQVDKCKRESVPQSKFILNSLQWSTWKLAMVPNIPCGTTLWWVGRGEDKPGFKRDSLFRGNFRTPAVYEIAVQPHSGAKRYVMYSKFATGSKAVRSWEKYLLRAKDIQSELDNVLESGCCVYIRRATCSEDTVRKAGHKLIRVYDYAWRRVRDVRSAHRDVRRSSVSISSPSF